MLAASFRGLAAGTDQFLGKRNVRRYVRRDEILNLLEPVRRRLLRRRGLLFRRCHRLHLHAVGAYSVYDPGRPLASAKLDREPFRRPLVHRKSPHGALLRLSSHPSCPLGCTPLQHAPRPAAWRSNAPVKGQNRVLPACSSAPGRPSRHKPVHTLRILSCVSYAASSCGSWTGIGAPLVRPPSASAQPKSSAHGSALIGRTASAGQLTRAVGAYCGHGGRCESRRRGQQRDAARRLPGSWRAGCRRRPRSGC